MSDAILETIKVTIGDRSFHTNVFQLLQWKAALRLEAKGFKLSRGRSVAAHIKKLAGLKKSTKIEALQELIEGLIEEARG